MNKRLLWYILLVGLGTGVYWLRKRSGSMFKAEAVNGELSWMGRDKYDNLKIGVGRSRYVIVSKPISGAAELSITAKIGDSIIKKANSDTLVLVKSGNHSTRFLVKEGSVRLFEENDVR